MVGAVGETASMKRRKLWKTGEDGLFCSSSAIQTRLDPSSLLEERSETLIVLLFLLCYRLPPKLGETAKVYRLLFCIVFGIIGSYLCCILCAIGSSVLIFVSRVKDK